MQEENLNFCAADETAAQPALDAKGATAEEMSATPLPDDRNKSSRTGDWGAPAAAGAYGGYGASAPYRAQPAERAGTFLPGGLPGTPGAQTLGALQDEVRRLRADARDRDLLADPDQGPVYGALRDKVQQVLRAGEAAGQPIGTDAAYAAVLLRELPGPPCSARPPTAPASRPWPRCRPTARPRPARWAARPPRPRRTLKTCPAASLPPTTSGRCAASGGKARRAAIAPYKNPTPPGAERFPFYAAE